MIIYDIWEKHHFAHEYTDIDLFVNSMLDLSVGRAIGEDETEWNIYGNIEEFKALHKDMIDVPGMLTLESTTFKEGTEDILVHNMLGPVGVLMNFIIVE
tara:strand:+ start:3568 stop:3864 length:297 start_codon:yes stop_codon:yes gene_type:complete